MTTAIDPERIDAPAALMDAIYRHQRHFYDVTRKYYLIGRDRLIAGLDPADGASVLELGCGTGRNLIATARRYPNARCFGLDLSAEMLKTAAGNVARAGLRGRIALAQADAAGFDPQALFGEPCFDRVFISYSLSMIPAWRDALASGLAALGPGGSLHVVDFGMQQRLPGWFGAVLRAWLARFHVSPRPDLEETMRALAAGRGATVEFAHLWRDYARAGVIRLA
ncbi:MAG: O-methyltransferase [Alphaproteobacteria bacterium]|nr:MAG: O-methyltransferase [Alphaproteobacteria bacterium]